MCTARGSQLSLAFPCASCNVLHGRLSSRELASYLRTIISTSLTIMICDASSVSNVSAPDILGGLRQQCRGLAH